MKHYESDLQKACIQWFDYQYPQIKDLLFAVPNGAMLAGNKLQRIKQGNRLKSEGMRPGVSDLILSVPAKGFHGLMIEMKYGKNTLSSDQKKWLTKVKAQGYMVEVVYTKERFMEIINNYLKK